MAETIIGIPVGPSLSVICNGRNSNSLANNLSFSISNPQEELRFQTTNEFNTLFNTFMESEGDLRRFNAVAIRRLKEIQCYRGIRHIQGTKNNCRTLKGKKVAIAGKKKAPR